MSWEAAEQKKEEGAQDENEGYWLSMQVLLNRRCFFYCKNVRRLTIQVRNGKKTAILALMDETSKKGKNKKPDSKLFYVYRSTILKKNSYFGGLTLDLTTFISLCVLLN